MLAIIIFFKLLENYEFSQMEIICQYHSLIVKFKWFCFESSRNAFSNGKITSICEMTQPITSTHFFFCGNVFQPSFSEKKYLSYFFVLGMFCIWSLSITQEDFLFSLVFIKIVNTIHLLQDPKKKLKLKANISYSFPFILSYC